METLVKPAEVIDPQVFEYLDKDPDDGFSTAEGLVDPELLDAIQGELPDFLEKHIKNIREITPQKNEVYPNYKRRYRIMTVIHRNKWLMREEEVREEVPHLMLLVDKLSEELNMDVELMQLNNYASKTMTHFHRDPSEKPGRKVMVIGLSGEGSFQLATEESSEDPRDDDFELDTSLAMKPGDAVLMNTRVGRLEERGEFVTRLHAGVNDSEDHRTILALVFRPRPIVFPTAA